MITRQGGNVCPRHIVVATDLTDTSHNTVAYAAALATRLSVPLTLAHALELRVLPEERGFEEVRTESEASVREQLDRQAGELREMGVTVSVALNQGPAAPTVAAMAERAGADLVIVGTHGRKGLERLVLGSVAEQIVRLSSCSVMVVRGRA
jgi:nucleotide-binding universal stress UspA family protein